MFDGLSVSSFAPKDWAPDTDVDLKVGDEHSYVKYSVGFSPETGKVWAVATSYVRKANAESWEFPWHQKGQTHLNHWFADVNKYAVSDSIIIILNKDQNHV